MSEFMARYCVNSKMSSPVKRWVPPKDGLKAGWAKFDGCSDFVVGSTDSKADVNLIHFYMGSPRPEYNLRTGRPTFGKSLLEELHDRGYDLSTLKFSVKKYADGSELGVEV